MFVFDEFVFYVPEEAGFVDVLDLDVGEGGGVLGAVVDEFFATIDEAIVPHFFESFIDARDDVFVESEG